MAAQSIHSKKILKASLTNSYDKRMDKSTASIPYFEFE
jgi:hypothetical protein